MASDLLLGGQRLRCLGLCCILRSVNSKLCWPSPMYNIDVGLCATKTSSPLYFAEEMIYQFQLSTQTQLIAEFVQN